jgi:hypothetical protein
MAVLGSECGRDSGRSGGGDQLTGSDLTLHGINGDGPGREDQEDLPGNHHTSRSAAPSCPRRRSEGDVGGTSGIGGDRRRGEGELPARPPQQQARPARPVVRPVARRHWRPDAAHACDAKRRSAAIDVEGIGYIHNMHCTSSSSSGPSPQRSRSAGTVCDRWNMAVTPRPRRWASPARVRDWRGGTGTGEKGQQWHHRRGRESGREHPAGGESRREHSTSNHPDIRSERPPDGSWRSVRFEIMYWYCSTVDT